MVVIAIFMILYCAAAVSNRLTLAKCPQTPLIMHYDEPLGIGLSVAKSEVKVFDYSLSHG